MIGCDILKVDEMDLVTGLIRRDCLESRLLKSVSVSLTEKHLYSVILFDIDHFKAVNDLLGHTQGDSVLKDVGSIMKSLDSEIGRYTGVYGRWGGEEFLVALPCANEDPAYALAEKIRSAVESYSFYDVNQGTTLEMKITVTLGVNTLDLKDIPQENHPERDYKIIDELVKNADLALSYGKLLGRNRVSRFGKYIISEMKNVECVRGFYYALSEDKDNQRLKRALSSSANIRGHSNVKETILRHFDTLKEIDCGDTRTKSVFADILYRSLRTMDSGHKKKVLNFIKYYLQGRYG